MKNLATTKGSHSDDSGTSLSAWIDGEGETHGLVWPDRLEKNALDQERWETWHLIGDVMRGVTPLSDDFNTRFAQRLAAEPTVLAPRVHRLNGRTIASIAAGVFVAVGALIIWPSQRPDSSPALPPLARSAINPSVEDVAANSPSLAAEVRWAPYLAAYQDLSPVTAASPYQRAVLVAEVAR
jgi:sigma-E factor negative regulatory protein RseA